MQNVSTKMWIFKKLFHVLPKLLHAWPKLSNVTQKFWSRGNSFGGTCGSQVYTKSQNLWISAVTLFQKVCSRVAHFFKGFWHVRNEKSYESLFCVRIISLSVCITIFAVYHFFVNQWFTDFDIPPFEMTNLKFSNFEKVLARAILCFFENHFFGPESLRWPCESPISLCITFLWISDSQLFEIRIRKKHKMPFCVKRYSEFDLDRRVL